MKTTVLTINLIEGYHCFPDAPEYLGYLRNKHRHVFHVECEFSVSHNDRDIEIISMQHQIDNYFKSTYGDPAEFGTLSCEEIASRLMQYYPKLCAVTVREDGWGGGRVTRGGI